MDGLIWALVIVGGPVLLGLAIWLFGDFRRRSSRTKKVSDQVARENWGKERIH